MFAGRTHSTPSISDLKRLLQSLSMLDAILSHSLGEAVYSFSDRWAPKQSVGIVKNGLGDDLFVVFESAGCFVKGFVHDIPLAKNAEIQQHLRQAIPRIFNHHLSEPAFLCDKATFFAWCESVGSDWESTTGMIGAENDGSSYFRGLLKTTPEQFQAWAEENYEADIDVEVISEIYNLHPLTNELAQSINPSVGLNMFRQPAVKIGYPISDSQ